MIGFVIIAVVVVMVFIWNEASTDWVDWRDS